ncbi:MAG: LamG domain-containing protein [Isosphaeraceae bacterium]|nr:LamG domain-containing protein [Isosphaeraceae bacterium]
MSYDVAYDPGLKPADLEEIQGGDDGPSLWLIADRDGRLYDLSGNRFQATNSGGVTSGRGPWGPIATYDGTGGATSVPWPFGAATTFTVMGWLRPMNSSQHAVLIDQRSAASTGFVVFANHTTGVVNIYSWTANLTVAGATNVFDGKLHHIAAVFDRATYSLFVDGKQEGSPQGPYVGYANSSFRIAEDYAGGCYPQQSDGLQLYSRVVSPSEIARWATAPYSQLDDEDDDLVAIATRPGPVLGSRVISCPFIRASRRRTA